MISKAPWRVVKKNQCRVFDADDHVVADCEYAPFDNERMYANAALIAKAPEMAEEIKTLQAQIKELEGAMTLACDKISEIKQKLYSVLSNK
jgi:hypothetical protein